MTTPRRVFPTFIPGPAAARHLPASTWLATPSVGAIVHAVRDGQGTDVTASVCGRRSSDWRKATGAQLVEARLCVSCGKRLYLDPMLTYITAAEVAAVHARVLRRALRHPDPQRGLTIRLTVRSAAIRDGSLMAGLDAVAARREGVWPSDALALIPTPKEAYGARPAKRDRVLPVIVPTRKRIRGDYTPESAR